MSLIQDALKRKAEEAARLQTYQPPTEAYQPPMAEAYKPAAESYKPPAEPSAPPADKKRAKPFFIFTTVTLVVALITVLAGLGVYLIKPKKPETASQIPVTEVSASVQKTETVIQVPVAEVKTAKSEPVAEPAKKDTAPPKLKENWPELDLTGVAQSDNQSIAIINGKMLSAGRKLGDVFIKEVHESDVVLEYRGEQRVLYINE